ncbi:MAG: acylphosphatase [Nocardioides sp.]
MRVHVEVTGRVQGVFFRDSCRREALRLGVSGWVRNSRAGSVEGEFEGEDRAVQELVDWCREGPPYASVSGVSVSPLTPTGGTGFEVR